MSPRCWLLSRRACCRSRFINARTACTHIQTLRRRLQGSGATSAGAAVSGESRRRLAQSEADAATGVAVSSSTVNVAGGCFPPFEDVEGQWERLRVGLHHLAGHKAQGAADHIMSRCLAGRPAAGQPCLVAYQLPCPSEPPCRLSELRRWHLPVSDPLQCRGHYSERPLLRGPDCHRHAHEGLRGLGRLCEWRDERRPKFCWLPQFLPACHQGAVVLRQLHCPCPLLSRWHMPTRSSCTASTLPLLGTVSVQAYCFVGTC